jgi:hypothetical protein
MQVTKYAIEHGTAGHDATLRLDFHTGSGKGSLCRPLSEDEYRQLAKLLAAGPAGAVLLDLARSEVVFVSRDEYLRHDRTADVRLSL